MTQTATVGDLPFTVDSMGYAAWWYAKKLGWHVFPCAPRGKMPAISRENGGRGKDDATNDLAQITAWWEARPMANIGWVPGRSGCVALDFDTEKPDFGGRELLDRLTNAHPTLAQRSGSGGLHLVYRLPDGVKLGDSADGLPRGVDVRTVGYIVIAPSIHPDGPAYAWLPGHAPHQVEAQPLPGFVLDMLRKRTAAPLPPMAPTAGDDVAKAREWLTRLSPWRVDDYGTDGAWVGVGMALSELGADGLALWEEWSARSAKYTPGECASKWKSFKPGAGIRLGSLNFWANQDDPIGAQVLVYSNGGGPHRDEADAPAGEDDDEGTEAHPLGVPLKQGLELGWIDDYADLMTHLVGSPRNFNIAIGLALGATAIQRRAWAASGHGMTFPNVYISLIAQSSVYRKSTSMAKGRSVLQRAMLDNLLLSELMTSEGLLKQLQEKPAGLIIRDEIGTLFSSHNTRYLQQLKPDLTALFDCYPYSRRLSHEEIKVQAPYLNILGATTPARFFDGVTFTDWQDGFLARWLFVLPEEEPDFSRRAVPYTPSLDGKVGALATVLMQIDRQRDTQFDFQPGALPLWDDWRRDAEKHAFYYGDDVAMAIVSRYSTYAIKFALILAALNGEWGTISKPTMQTAMDLADGFKATAYRLLNEKQNWGVSGAKLQKVFRFVQNAGPDGATARQLARVSNMRKAELTPVLEKLAEVGAVMIVNVGRTDRYIPAVEKLPAKAWK